MQAEREKAEREAEAAKGDGKDGGAAKQKDKGAGAEVEKGGSAGGKEAAVPAAPLADDSFKRCLCPQRGFGPQLAL